MANLLVIDNYDSFTYNLVQMFMHYDLTIDVRRSDGIGLHEIENGIPDYILISPGPKDPANAGISVRLIQTFFERVPILGICLGMQCINEAFGGMTVRSPVPVHGKRSLIRHDHSVIFDGIPEPFQAARYHSLMSLPLTDTLTVTAYSADGLIMGLSHPRFPLHGVQFHPESFLTEYGSRIIDNFLRLGKKAEALRYG